MLKLQEWPYSAAASISSSSWEVSGIGLPFMLLACAAFSTRTTRCSSAIP